MKWDVQNKSLLIHSRTSLNHNFMVISGSWAYFWPILPGFTLTLEWPKILDRIPALHIFFLHCHIPSMLSLEILSKMALQRGREWWLLLGMILTSHDLGFYQISCDLKKKKKKQPCHCFIFQCSVSCGRGHKQRNVYCMAKDGSHLESDYCKHLAKPNGHRKCRGGRCPKWKAGAWSQVSNTSPQTTSYFPLATWLTPVCWLVSLLSFSFLEGSVETGKETALCQNAH